jgi:uncharacterized protein (TIGR02231 family)
VHVDQAADSGDLRLIRQAVIRQNTREDWRDVALSLSTASLTARSGTGLPGSMLYYLVDKDTIRPLEQFNAKGSAVRSEMAPMADAEQVTGMASGAMPVVLGQTLEFDLGTVASVDGDGGDQLVRLDALEEQVRLYARANAVQDATAYLYADVTNSTGGTLLAGPAVLYRDGTLTGQAFIPETLAGDVTELPLGPLNGLRLEHHTLKTEAGEGGFVTKSTTRTQRFEVTVDSSLDYAIDLTVYAALPVSEDEALTVRLETVPNPSDQNIEGRRGVTGWTKSIAPGASTTIEYGWTLSWPEDKLLQQR